MHTRGKLKINYIREGRISTQIRDENIKVGLNFCLSPFVHPITHMWYACVLNGRRKQQLRKDPSYMIGGNYYASEISELENPFKKHQVQNPLETRKIHHEGVHQFFFSFFVYTLLFLKKHTLNIAIHLTLTEWYDIVLSIIWKKSLFQSGSMRQIIQ